MKRSLRALGGAAYLAAAPKSNACTLAIGKAGARNAGLLAARIIARAHPEVREKVRAQREKMRAEVEAKDAALQEKINKQ